MTGQQWERLTKMQPRLTRVAWAIHRNHYPEQDAQDILQEMNLHIVARVHDDPSHFTHPDKYIVNGAAWYARTWCRNQHARRQVSLDGLDWTLSDDSPDAELSVDVTNALAALDEDARQVANALAAGLAGADLYAATGLNRQQLTRRRRDIRRVLAGALVA